MGETRSPEVQKALEVYEETHDWIIDSEVHDPVRKIHSALGDLVHEVLYEEKNGQRTTGREPAEGANPEVDHPVHYNTHPSGVECIEIVRHMGFNLGNVVKYLWRDGIKDKEVELQDLEKALWYLNDEIEMRKCGISKSSEPGAGTESS